MRDLLLSFVAARPDVMIFLAVCIVIVAAIYLIQSHAYWQWINSLVQMAERDIDNLHIKRLTQAQLDQESMPSGHISGAAWLDSFFDGDEKTVMSDVYEFTVGDHQGILTFRMRPDSNEFLLDSVKIRGSKFRPSFDMKDRLKKAGNEAYTMWKMTQ